jgi:hypothetical protein
MGRRVTYIAYVKGRNKSSMARLHQGMNDTLRSYQCIIYHLVSIYCFFKKYKSQTHVVHFYFTDIICMVAIL